HPACHRATHEGARLASVAAPALRWQAQRRGRIRRPLRRRGHPPGRERGPRAGDLPVLPDGGPTGRRLPADDLRRGPVRAARAARTPADPPARLDAAVGIGLTRLVEGRPGAAPVRPSRLRPRTGRYQVKLAATRSGTAPACWN